MEIKLTEAAVKEIKHVFQESELDCETTYVRIGISGGGCSGFMYKMEFTDEIDDTKDTVESFDGVRVVVDKKSMLYLDGTTLDWYSDLTKRGFKFDNPNAVKVCGCGTSFSA